MKDSRGNEIEVGDLIAYATRGSCSAYMKFGTVTRLRTKPGRYGGEPDPRIQIRSEEHGKLLTLGHPDKIVVIKKGDEKFRLLSNEAEQMSAKMLDVAHSLLTSASLLTGAYKTAEDAAQGFINDINAPKV